MKLENGNILVRVGSHRASAYMDRELGRHPQFYWTWDDGGVFAELTPEEFSRIMTLKRERRARWWASITKARPSGEPAPCWGV